MAQSLAAFEAGTLLKHTARQLRVDVKIKLFIENTLKKKALTVAQRVRIAGQFLHDKVKVNLSRPVRKITSRVTKRVTVDRNSRSKPGEFPRADTTRLMKDVFHVHDNDNPLHPSSKIGTTLKYGLLLEVAMNRSFLRRTLNELRSRILQILQGGGSVGGVS